MDFLTADLIDEYGDSLRTCELQFRQYGGKRRFHGPVRTVRTVDDNALIRRTLSEPGNAGVLVVDGAGSLRCALVGDMIAALAERNGWSGLVIHGAVRDTLALGKLDVGVKALGSNPRKSRKEAGGEVDVPLAFGGLEIRPGDWLYSDEDGIVVSDREL